MVRHPRQVRRFVATLIVALMVPAQFASASDDLPYDPFDITDDGADVCLSYDGSEGRCGDPLARDDQAAVITQDYEGDVIAGLVPAAAATVELRFSIRTVRVKTVPPKAYTGRLAGQLTTFRATVPPERGDDRGGEPDVLLRDASGALIGVRPNGFDGRTVRARTLFRLRLGGTLFRFRETTTETLRPTVLDLGAVAGQRCLALARPLGGSASCYRRGFPDLVVDADGTCAGNVVHGLTPPGTTGRLTLGDGRRVALRTTRFDARHDAFAGGVPAGSAVRRIELTRDGTTRRLELGIPPATLDCRGGAFGPPLISEGEPPPRPVTAERDLLVAGGHRLRAAQDPDGRLCLAVDDEPFATDACQDLARGPGSVETATRRLPDGGSVVAGLARTGAPAVRIRVGRLARTVRTVELDTVAAGLHAGHARGFLLVLPRGRVSSSVQALDAAGRVIDPEVFASAFVAPVEPEPGPTAIRRIGRVSGDRVAWTYRLGGADCVVTTAGRRPGAQDYGPCAAAGRSTDSGLFEAPCGSRRIVATAMAVGTSARVAVWTTAGRLVPLRRTGLAGGVGAFVVALPPGTGVRETVVRKRGRKAQRFPTRLPPGAAQCGYAGYVFLG